MLIKDYQFDSTLLPITVNEARSCFEGARLKVARDVFVVTKKEVNFFSPSLVE